MFAILLALSITFPKIDATVGYAAEDFSSGRTISSNADQRFPMGSVFKLPLSLTVLHLVDQKKLDLETKYTIEPKDFSPGYSPIRDGAHGKPVTLTLRELIRYALSVSDNTAADFLMTLIGGPDVVNTHITRGLGVRGISVNRTEKQMAADLKQPGGVEKYAVDPRDTATPAAIIELLRVFHERHAMLSPESFEFAKKAMEETKTGANRMHLVIPAGATLAHKTGTMPGTVNDVGIITSPDGVNHIAIAIFVKGSKDKEAVGEAVIAEIAKQIYAGMRR